MRNLIRFASGKWELDGRSCFIDNNSKQHFPKNRVDQVLSDLIKQKVFLKSNLYYSYHRKSTNKQPKSLYISHFLEGPTRREGLLLRGSDFPDDDVSFLVVFAKVAFL